MWPILVPGFLPILKLASDGRYDGDDAFPERDDVKRALFKLIDLGRGKPEDVMRTAIMRERTEALERAIETHLRDLKCHAADWMQKSKMCKQFVSNIEAGLATNE